MLKSVLEYPLDDVPRSGTMVPVCPGIRWLRLPLPMALDHINLWVLDGDDGAWDLVDTGLDLPASRELWRALFSGPLNPDRLGRIVVTHMHPDHAGLAGWLQQKTGASFFMSRTEYLMCRVLCSDPPGQPPEVALQFYRNAGFEAQQIAEYVRRFGTFGAVISPLPLAYHRLQAGEQFRGGGRNWRLLEGCGHSPEHICLFCEDDNLLISGDQLLPAISSNVSVWPTEPLANPLADWLASCEYLAGEIDNQTLVLPSHGKPFRGGVTRLEWLIQHHHDQLQTALEVCAKPATVREVVAGLFRRKLSGTDFVMAAGEAIAHLNFLVDRNEIVVDRSGPVHRYHRA